jgi:hypothetical protein
MSPHAIRSGVIATSVKMVARIGNRASHAPATAVKLPRRGGPVAANPARPSAVARATTPTRSMGRAAEKGKAHACALPGEARDGGVPAVAT